MSSDDEALALMNDSPYGLTASVWTAAPDAFAPFVDGLEAGTVFLNRCVLSFLLEGFSVRGHFTPGERRRKRKWLMSCVCVARCDYLDPALSWTGVKNSGRGVSLSKFGASSALFLSLSVIGGCRPLAVLSFPSTSGHPPLTHTRARLRPAHARQERAHEDRHRLDRLKDVLRSAGSLIQYLYEIERGLCTLTNERSVINENMYCFCFCLDVGVRYGMREGGTDGVSRSPSVVAPYNPWLWYRRPLYHCFMI